MATEDRRYREHSGVDPIGLVRAIGVNVQAGGAAEGASTIEMQLARNLFFADERTEQTLARKTKEALAAIEMNKRYSKDDLLEAYLNVVYYGHRAYGAEAAARTYFGKSARDLTLSEATLIAGLPQSPGTYDPLQNLTAARARQQEVLARMVGESLITADEAYQAHAAPIELAPAQLPPTRAPHWVNYIEDHIRARFGPEALFTGGLHIHTTIDLGVQQFGEQIVGRNERGPTPGARQQHGDGRDRAGDRPGAGDGRQHRLLRPLDRRRGQRRHLDAPSRARRSSRWSS